MSRSIDERRRLLGDLKIERDLQPNANSQNQNNGIPWRGLLLGVVVILISCGLVAINWRSIEAIPVETNQEPALGSESLKEQGRNNHGTWERSPPDHVAPAMSGNPGASAYDELDTVLDATGYVVARRKVTVNTKITGRLTRVLFEEGDYVVVGQTLALLDDSEAQAELALAESQLESVKSRVQELLVLIELADRRLSRSTELAKRHLVSRSTLDEDHLAKEELNAKLKRTEAEINVARRRHHVRKIQLKDTRILAPFSGVVTTRSGEPGEVVSAMTTGVGITQSGIGTIVDMDSLEVEVDINEAYLNKVFVHQPVWVEPNAYSGSRYAGVVIAIVPVVDRSKATVRVRIGLRERNDLLLPNMGVQIGFIASGLKEAA